MYKNQSYTKIRNNPGLNPREANDRSGREAGHDAFNLRVSPGSFGLALNWWTASTNNGLSVLRDHWPPIVFHASIWLVLKLEEIISGWMNLYRGNLSLFCMQM